MRHWIISATVFTSLLASPCLAQERRMDLRKAVIEAPVAKVLMNSDSLVTSGASARSKRVAGLVTWRSNLGTAIDAAAKTGKPILHFQLLGRLDEEFC